MFKFKFITVNAYKKHMRKTHTKISERKIEYYKYIEAGHLADLYFNQYVKITSSLDFPDAPEEFVKSDSVEECAVIIALVPKNLFFTIFDVYKFTRTDDSRWDLTIFDRSRDSIKYRYYYENIEPKEYLHRIIEKKDHELFMYSKSFDKFLNRRVGYNNGND